MSISTIWESAAQATAPAMARIATICGSLRKASYNRKILAIASQGIEQHGGQAVYVDLFELNLPMYNEDMESAGVPKSVTKFVEAIRDADAVLIATPENNWGVPACLKNAIDWSSRAVHGNVWGNKPVATIGATIGGFGTLQGQISLRNSFHFLKANHLPNHVLVSRVHELFTESGELKDSELKQRLIKFGGDLVGKVKPK